MKEIDICSLMRMRRSVRLFGQKKIPFGIIKKVVNAARLAPSAANLQFIEYLVICEKEQREKIFPCLRWAGYIAPKRNPSQDKTPTVYIIILIAKDKSKEPNLRDIGAAAQSMLLTLTYLGAAGCWLQNIDKESLRRSVRIPDRYDIDSIIAAGYPAETPHLETDARNIRYWLDAKNRLHVPKRPLGDIFHYNYIK
ncbi:MAG: nitroreductase family protein [Candidatus Omnitrophota bacterium]